MKPKKAHLLFEQSGTFKNEFIKLGVPAEDYDIMNDFGQTDHIIDLFGEIEKAYGGGTSVFDAFSTDDIVMAFFPCVRFEDQMILWFKGNNYAESGWDLCQKLEYDLKSHDELNNLYRLVTKMAIVCLRKGLNMVLENPYSVQHYLKRYWAAEPEIIDLDRSTRGDYYKKPTQYWFFGFKPSNNLVFEPMDLVSRHRVDYATSIDGKSLKVSRSMIHPQYANRFIREFILDGE